MFVDFQLSAMKIKVIDYLNLIQNWVFQFSIADFYLFKTGLSNMLNKSLSSYLQLGNNQWKIIVAFCSLPSYLSSGFYFWIVKLSPWVHLA